MNYPIIMRSTQDTSIITKKFLKNNNKSKSFLKKLNLLIERRILGIICFKKTEKRREKGEWGKYEETIITANIFFFVKSKFKQIF